MKHIFYIVWVIYLMNELNTLFNPHKQTKTVKDLFKMKREKRANVQWDDLDSDQKKTLKGFVFILLPAMIFRYIGLLSYNWFFFLVWIIFGFLTAPIAKEINHRFDNNFTALKLYTSISATINVAFALLVILNSYHFYIDNTALFKNLMSQIWP